MVGKWHLGHADPIYWPRQRGFDYHYGAVIGEIDYFTRESHGVLDWQRNNRPVRETGYVTELLGADAVKIIEQSDGKTPLFLYLAFTAPHAPYQAPQAYVDRFQHIADPTRRSYAGMISCMDDAIGTVVAALERKGMRGNTAIVWHSDNGGTKNKMFAGEGDVSKITIPCDNGSLRGGKGELYEGGTRVQCVVNWPGHVKPGSIVTGMAHIVDMFPTIAGLAQAQPTGGKPLDGIDLWPAISTGAATNRHEVVYNVEPFMAAVRQGDWKLVWKTILPSNIELFNIANDPNETTNLATQEPARVQALQARVEQLSREGTRPLFLEASMNAVMGGLFGPAPIPTMPAPADNP